MQATLCISTCLVRTSCFQKTCEMLEGHILSALGQTEPAFWTDFSAQALLQRGACGGPAVRALSFRALASGLQGEQRALLILLCKLEKGLSRIYLT